MKKIFLIIVLPFLFLVCKPQETVDEVLQKSMKAIGGIDAFNNVKSMKEIGIFKISADGSEQKGTYIRYRTQEKYIQVLILEGIDTMYSGVSGNISWDYNSTAGYKESKLERIRNPIVPQFFYYKDDFMNYAITGKQTVDSKNVNELALKDKQGNDRLWYIDTEKYYLLKSYRTSDDEGVKSIHEDIFDNYTTVNGLTFPFKVTQTISNGKRLTTFNWETQKIEINIDSPESNLKPPAK